MVNSRDIVIVGGIVAVVYALKNNLFGSSGASYAGRQSEQLARTTMGADVYQQLGDAGQGHGVYWMNGLMHTMAHTSWKELWGSGVPAKNIGRPQSAGQNNNRRTPYITTSANEQLNDHGYIPFVDRLTNHY